MVCSRIGIAAMMALLFVACDIQSLTDSASSLLDPDATLVSGPGVRLVAGEVFDLEISTSTTDGPLLSAMERRDGATHLLLIDPARRTFCDTGPSSRRLVVHALPDGRRLAVASLLDGDGDGWGEVRLFNRTCELIAGPISSAALPNIVFPQSPHQAGVVLQSQFGDLIHLDLEDHVGRETRIASSTDGHLAFAEELWVIDDGELVRFSPKLEELERLGRGVRTLIGSPFHFGEADFLYLDEDGLHRETAFGQGQRRRVMLGEDACQPILFQGVATYFQPCEERTVILDLSPESTRVEAAFARIVGRSNTIADDGAWPHYGHAIARKAWRFEGEKFEIYYASSDEANQSEGFLHYWVGNLDLTTDNWSEEAQAFLLEIETTPTAKKARLIDDIPFGSWDGKAGTLYALPANGDTENSLPFTPLANKVVQVFGGYELMWGALAEYDGELGTFIFVSSPHGNLTASEATLKNVAPEFSGVLGSTQHFALTADVQNSLGRIYIGDRISQQPLDGPYGTEVRPSSVVLTDEPLGAAYLSGSTSGPADLRVYHQESQLDVLIHERVIEHQWSNILHALVYVVSSGDDAGIWIAKAR